MKTPRLDNLLIQWARFCERYALWVLIAFIPLLVAAVFFIVTRLGMNTDLSDMISEKLEFHHRWKQYRSEFPNLNENFIVVLKSKDSSAAYHMANEVVRKARESSAFESTIWLTGGDFFEKNQALFLDKSQLENQFRLFGESRDLIHLYSSQASPEAISLVAAALSGKTQANSFVDHVILNLKQPNEGIDYASLVFDQQSSTQFIEIKPKMDYEKILPAETSYLELKSILKEAQQDLDVSAGITGSAALSYEEMRSVSEGAGLSGLLSLVLVAFILTWGIRSFPLIGLSLSTLIVGLILTGAFAAVAIGHLNMISIAFAVLFIGLGVDYSVHLGLRYRELLTRGLKNSDALEETIKEIGVSLILCTLTTAAGFYAFVPTSYSGVSELGLISGTGMVINLLIHLSLFPAYFSLFPLKLKKTARLGQSLADRLSEFAFHSPRWIGRVAIPIFILCFPALFYIRFDPNPLNLQNPDTEAYRTYRDLMQSGATSPWSIKILVDSKEEEQSLQTKLEQLPLVSQVLSLTSFIPADQDDKMRMLHQLNLPPLNTQVSEDRRRVILRQAMASLENKTDDKSQELKDLLAERQESGLLDMEQATKDSNQFYQILRSFGSIGRLTEESLPKEWRDRFVGKTGKRKLEVFPQEDLMEISAMKKFADQVSAIAPQATDDPVTLPLSGEAVVQAFITASVIASVLIFVLAYLMTFSVLDSALIFVPLIFSAVVLKALMIVLNIDFNFANIIVLPLLLGIGIDSGLHLIHRFRTKNPQEAVTGSTQRAVFVSSLTTVMSFGTLAFSAHRGTASMGILLTIGTLVIMIATLSLLPALLSQTRKEKLKQAA